MRPSKEMMQKAIQVARSSARKGDYAVGAVVVKGTTVIATGQTKLKRGVDPTAHPEIVAIRAACKKLGTRFLNDCVLYVTHEPCPMCASAAIWARMKGVVFGCYLRDAPVNKKATFTWKQIPLSCKSILKKGIHPVSLTEGFMRKECLGLFELSN